MEFDLLEIWSISIGHVAFILNKLNWLCHVIENNTYWPYIFRENKRHLDKPISILLVYNTLYLHNPNCRAPHQAQ